MRISRESGKRKWSLRVKLIAALLLVSAMVAASSLYQMAGTRQVSDVFDDLAHNDLKRLLVVRSIDLDLLGLHHVIVSEQTADDSRRLTIAEQQDILQGTTSSVRGQIDEYREHVEDDDGEEGLQAIAAIATDAEAVFTSSTVVLAARSQPGSLV